MDIKTRVEGDITIVEIAGSLDGSTSPEAQEKITPLLVPGCRLVLDMSACDYISSAGLRLLLIIARQLSLNAGKGAFAALSEEIRDVMAMTGFDHMFNYFETVSKAMQYVRTEGT